jgi:glycosyltransferase involved in cell wall biosynthesis
MNSATVSVVIPCFNQGRFLGEALQSLDAQTRLPTEVVVVDDGSTDETASVARRFARVTLVQRPHQGLAAARNVGIAATSGEYLVFLDADDRLRPEALATGMRELDEHPDCAFVYGHCERIDEQGQRLPTGPPLGVTGDHYAALLYRNYIWTPAVVMFRRSACGGQLRFARGVDPAADLELYLRLTRRLRVCAHTHVVADYRMHRASLSRRTPVMLSATMTVLRAQRPYIARHPQYALAYREGVRMWRAYYGQLLVEDVRRMVKRPGQWRNLASSLALLARYYPQGLLTEGQRRFRR